MKKAFPKTSQADSETPIGLRRGGMLAAGSIAASAFTTLCSLSATVLILRALPREQAGRFAFLVELLYSVGLLGSLGQPILQARLYQQRGAEHFDWLRDTSTTVAITAPLIAVAALGIAMPYGLTAFEIVFLVVGAELFIAASCFSGVLSQQRHYAWSSALLRMGNGLMIVPAILMPAFAVLRRLDLILVGLLVFLGIAALLGALLLTRWLKRGEVQITFRERVSGLVFLASLLALVVPQRGLIVVAGAMLDPGTVAALAAVVSILRVFDLVGESAGRVFSTEMARHSRHISGELYALPWLLAGSMAAAVLFGLPAVLHRFYGGRYDLALPLVPWLVAAAALRLVEVVPRGFLFYLAPSRLLHRFAAAQSAAATVGIVLMVISTLRFGVKGLVWVAALISLARLGISYLFVIPLRPSAVSAERLVIEPVESSGQEPPI